MRIRKGWCADLPLSAVIDKLRSAQRVFFTLFASIFIGAAETFLYIRFFSRSTSNERPPKRISSKRRRPSKLAKPIAIRGPAVRSGHRDHLRQRAIANRLRRETSSSGKPEVDESKKAR